MWLLLQMPNISSINKKGFPLLKIPQEVQNTYTPGKNYCQTFTFNDFIPYMQIDSFGV